MYNLRGKNSDRIRELKRMYHAAKSDKVHANWRFCQCFACFWFYVKDIKKFKVDMDNFFLYWLANIFSDPKDPNKEAPLYNKDLDRDWRYILDLFYNVTGNKNEKIYFEKRLPAEVPKHYWIVSRFDKKLNLDVLISEKEQYEFWQRFKSSARRFLYKEEIIPFLKSYKKYAKDECYDPFFDPDKYYSGFGQKISAMIRLLSKIACYLIDRKEELKQRELQRKFSLKQSDLFPVLDVLESEGVIEWDRTRKTVLLHRDWIKRLKSFCSQLRSYSERLTRIKESLTFRAYPKTKFRL